MAHLDCLPAAAAHSAFVPQLTKGSALRLELRARVGWVLAPPRGVLELLEALRAGALQLR